MDNKAPPRQRLWRHVAVALFLLVQLGLPTSYYLQDDIYDERFAWRMFSPIRMVKCNVALAEGRGGEPKPLKASSQMSLPWINWMKRGHSRVLLGYARHRCEAASQANAPISFHASLSCRLPGGDLDRLFDPSEDLCKRF